MNRILWQIFKRLFLAKITLVVLKKFDCLKNISAFLRKQSAQVCQFFRIGRSRYRQAFFQLVEPDFLFGIYQNNINSQDLRQFFRVHFEYRLFVNFVDRQNNVAPFFDETKRQIKVALKIVLVTNIQNFCVRTLNNRLCRDFFLKRQRTKRINARCVDQNEFLPTHKKRFLLVFHRHTVPISNMLI